MEFLRPLSLINIFLMFCVLGIIEVIDSCGQGVYCFQKGHRATKHLRMLHHCPFWGVYLYKDCQVCCLKIVYCGCRHAHATLIGRSEDSSQKSILAFHHANVGLLFLWLCCTFQASCWELPGNFHSCPCCSDYRYMPSHPAFSVDPGVWT